MLHNYSSERMAGPEAKIERAKEHIADLDNEIRQFLLTKPYSIRPYCELNTHHFVYLVGPVPRPPPSISVIVGDVVHNLRSALDHLAHELVDIGTSGRGPFDRCAFPFANSMRGYFSDCNTLVHSKSTAEKVSGMTPEAIQHIDSLTPYRGGDNDLWAVHKLSNTDKHRALIVAGARWSGIYHSPSGAMLRPTKLWRLRENEGLWPISGKDGFPYYHPEGDNPFTFEITLAEPAIDGTPLTEFMQKLLAHIEAIIEGFRPFLAD